MGWEEGFVKKQTAREVGKSSGIGKVSSRDCEYHCVEEEEVYVSSAKGTGKDKGV